jgi:hypothetical protein
VRRLGYAEFDLAGRMLRNGRFRGQLNGELAVHALEDSLAKAATPEDYWTAVREAGRKLGFTHAELRLRGRRFEAVLAQSNGNRTWNLDIPLGEEGHLRLARCFGDGRAPGVLSPFADVLHRKLARAADAGEEQTRSAAAGQ